jgi:hypothetical protein
MDFNGLGIILEKKNGGPSAWTRGPLAVLRFTVHDGPRIGIVAGARQNASHRRSCVRDLAVMAREARGGGGGSLPRLARDGGGAQTAGRRWTEVAAGVSQQEGARGAEVRKGGERQVRCGEAEMGAHFIRLGKRL